VHPTRGDVGGCCYGSRVGSYAPFFASDLSGFVAAEEEKAQPCAPRG
jgi:hypothetical protein